MIDRTPDKIEPSDVVVVGGGLAGLTAALVLSREGRSVTLLEKSSRLGGRAATQDEDGFKFNLGPHALYCQGAATRILTELGVPIRGGIPDVRGRLVRGGRDYRLPTGLPSLLRTRAIGLGSRLEVARLLIGMQHVDPEALHGVTVDDWLQTRLKRADARALVRTMFRLSTYADESSRQSARAAIAQFRMGAGGVRYLGGGWQSLVDALAAKAEAHGVRIINGASCEEVVFENGRATGVRLRGGRVGSAQAVLLATCPSGASALLASTGAESVKRFARTSVPVRAACLDLGLRRLPNPDCTFALGLDEPHYFSVHTRSAKLAPDGGAMIHVARYRSSDDSLEPEEIRRRLEGLLDLLQPGWREELAAARFLPAMVPASALDRAAGGVPGRPSVQVPEVRGVFLAGDWVGDEGMLADASVASGFRAARTIVNASRRRPEVTIAHATV